MYSWVIGSYSHQRKFNIILLAGLYLYKWIFAEEGIGTLQTRKGVQTFLMQQQPIV